MFDSVLTGLGHVSQDQEIKELGKRIQRIEERLDKLDGADES